MHPSRDPIKGFGTHPRRGERDLGLAQGELVGKRLPPFPGLTRVRVSPRFGPRDEQVVPPQRFEDHAGFGTGERRIRERHTTGADNPTIAFQCFARHDFVLDRDRGGARSCVSRPLAATVPPPARRYAGPCQGPSRWSCDNARHRRCGHWPLPASDTRRCANAAWCPWQWDWR